MALFGAPRAPVLNERTAPQTFFLGPGVLQRTKPLRLPTAAAAVDQATKPTRRSKFSAEAKELVSWLRAGGGACRDVQDAMHPVRGRTLVASKTIEKGQQLVKVPPSRELSNLTREDALVTLLCSSPSVANLFEATPPILAKHLALALALVLERISSDSKWRPYLACLPADVSHLPLYWSEEDLLQLQHQAAIEQLLLQREWIETICKETAAEGAILDGVVIDAQLLSWGLAVARSRSFSDGERGELSVLRPLMDLCSHSPAPNCAWEEVPGGTGLVATKSIAQGEELTLHYGPLPNADLLLSFGFIVPGNAFDRPQFACHLEPLLPAAGTPAAVELQPWQAAALEQFGFSKDSMMVEIGRSQPIIDPRLLAAARVLCCESATYLVACADVQRLGDIDKPLGVAPLEVRALRKVQRFCAHCLEAMPTTAAHDRSLLASAEPRLTPSQELAVRYRLEVKDTVRAAVAHIEGHIRKLQAQQGRRRRK